MYRIPGKKLLLASASLLACLLLLELGARAIFAFSGLEPVLPVQIGRADAQLGWSLRPNARASSSRLGEAVEYRINSDGWRDDETPQTKPSGVFRIVLLGDSITFGFGVPLHLHFSRLLEGYFDKLEVINLGVNGYGIDQELLALRNYGFRYEPDLVMAYVAHYGDQRHMHTSRWGKSKPRFVLQNNKLQLQNSPIKGVIGDAGALGTLHNALYEHSRAYLIFSEILERVTSDAPTAHTQKAEDQKRQENPEFVEAMNELGGAIVFEMRKESKAHGANFVLITQVSDLASRARSRDIPVLNPEAALDNPLYKPADEAGHPNAAANGVLAWEIAQFLVEQKLLPGGP